MIVQYHKKFLKDLSVLPGAYRKRIEIFAFETVPTYKSIREISGAQKLKGYSRYYKIRIGDYRIGFMETETGIIFERDLHRKEIYRHFPI